MSEYIQFQDELMHHGVKGMHWGVRRYQNEDGSLTDFGKRKVLTFRGRRKMTKGLNEAENKIVNSKYNISELNKPLAHYKKRANKAKAKGKIKKYKKINDKINRINLAISSNKKNIENGRKYVQRTISSLNKSGVKTQSKKVFRQPRSQIAANIAGGAIGSRYMKIAIFDSNKHKVKKVKR